MFSANGDGVLTLINVQGHAGRRRRGVYPDSESRLTMASSSQGLPSHPRRQIGFPNVPLFKVVQEPMGVAAHGQRATASSGVRRRTAQREEVVGCS